MRAILAMAALVTVGFVVAGCGSAKKAVSGSFTVTGTTTISNVKTGSRVSCTKVGPSGLAATASVIVPARGQGMNAGSSEGTVYPPGPTSYAVIQLMHLQDGYVTVSCKR